MDRQKHGRRWTLSSGIVAVVSWIGLLLDLKDIGTIVIGSAQLPPKQILFGVAILATSVFAVAVTVWGIEPALDRWNARKERKNYKEELEAKFRRLSSTFSRADMELLGRLLRQDYVVEKTLLPLSRPFRRNFVEPLDIERDSAGMTVIKTLRLKREILDVARGHYEKWKTRERQHAAERLTVNDVLFLSYLTIPRDSLPADLDHPETIYSDGQNLAGLARIDRLSSSRYRISLHEEAVEILEDITGLVFRRVQITVDTRYVVQNQSGATLR